MFCSVLLQAEKYTKQLSFPKFHLWQANRQTKACMSSCIFGTIILTKNTFGCILVCQLACLPAPNGIPENSSTLVIQLDR